MIMGIGHNGGSCEGGGRESEGLKGGSFLKGWTRGEVEWAEVNHMTRVEVS